MWSRTVFLLHDTAQWTWCNNNFSHIHIRDGECNQEGLEKSVFAPLIEVKHVPWKKNQKFPQGLKECRDYLKNSDAKWWCGCKGHFCNASLICCMYRECISNTKTLYLMALMVILLNTVPMNDKITQKNNKVPRSSPS